MDNTDRSPLQSPLGKRRNKFFSIKTIFETCNSKELNLYDKQNIPKIKLRIKKCNTIEPLTTETFKLYIREE